jgi:hypothetical protein
MLKRIWLASTIFLLTACIGCPAWGQVTSAHLSGVVADATGAVVPGGKVVVKNASTGLTQTAISDASGIYQFQTLPPGEYSVTAEANGFAVLVQRGVVLTVGQSATLNLALKTGTVAETVTVEGDAEQLNTTTAEISQVMEEDEVRDLPLNGRDPSSLVNLAAGVTNELISQASTLPTSNSFPTESGASAGGGRQGSTWYLLDGVSNMDTYALLAAPFPNADATQEFRVISNNFDARYGFAPSAVVSIQTKSGTNKFHGGAFEFIRNNDLNASNWFTGNVDKLKRNQFGGYVGGPVFHDKLFFFTNYQGTRSSYNSASNTTYTPTQAMLDGDFSSVPATDLSGPLASVFTTINGKAQQVNTSKFSAGALAIAKSLPLGTDSTTGKTNFVNPAQTLHYNENTSRLDYNINSNQRIFLRSFLYNYNQPGASTPGNMLAGVNGQNGTYLNLVVGHTWTISQSLVNSATLSWAELNYKTGTIEKDSSGAAICMSRFIEVDDPSGSCYISGLTAFDGNVLYGGGLGFNAFTGSPNDTHRRYWWFTDTVTKTIGRHTLTAGADIMHRYGSELYSGSQNPGVTFNGQYTGFPLSDFLLGYMSSFSQGAGESGSESGWMTAYYAQDQFKMNARLTVTAGLRWDPYLPLSIKNGRGAAFVPGQQSTRYPNAPEGLVFPGDSGVPSGLMPTSYGYYEPRIGIAWQAHPDTSVRAGFGMFTTPIEDAFYNKVWDAAPFAPSYGLNGTFDSTGATASVPLSFDTPWSGFTATGGTSPFPPFASAAQLPASSVSFANSLPASLPAVFANNFKIGLTESWNLSVDQQLTRDMALHVGYVGSFSYHIATTVEQNPGIYKDSGARTTYSNFGSIIQVQDGATGNYHALQVSVDKRFAHHFQLHSNFTWSRTMDVGGSGDPSFESSVSDPYDIRHDYGPSSLNYPIIWVSNFSYQLPLLKSSAPLLRHSLGGWEVTGLYTAQSGPPFTINGGEGNNNSEFQVGQDRADLVPGQSFGVRTGGKSHWLNEYFNTSAFTNNAAGTPGNAKKFLIQEAPIYTADLAVLKNWTWGGIYKLQFRWEAFNALNHPSFGQPDSNPGDSSFGQITGIGAIPPRVMQGGLKLSF